MVLTGFGRAKRLTDRAKRTRPVEPTCLLDVPARRTSRRWRPTWATAGAASTACCTRSRSRPRTRSAAASDHAAGERDHRVPDERVLVQGARRRLRRPLPRRGASVVGMDFDASVAWPVYDWMGVAKAAPSRLRRATSAARRARQPRQRRPDRDARRARRPGSRSSRTPGRSRRRSAGHDDAARRRRGLLLLPDVARDHGRDPPRRRRLPRDGHAARGHGGHGRAAAKRWRHEPRASDRRDRLPRHGGARPACSSAATTRCSASSVRTTMPPRRGSTTCSASSMQTPRRTAFGAHALPGDLTAARRAGG